VGDLHSFLLFVGATIVLCIVPGPDMAYMLTRTLTQGRRAGIMAAVGINLGGYFHVFAAVLGISALLAASSAAFTVVKWVGAAYLIWIGLRTLASKSGSIEVTDGGRPLASNARIFWEGFLSDALNPKVAIFFLAFLPQFVDRESTLPVPLQLLLLGVTSNMVAILINVTLVHFASVATRAIRQRTSWTAWLNRLAGGLFIALGVRLAREKL
jgi:threonine/homoserine/homoserine lactone efflux protein